MVARVSIFNADRTFHEEVNVYVNIVGIPAKGSLLYLNQRDKEKLIELITKDHETAYICDIYYYGLHSYDMEFDEFKLIPLSVLKEKSSVDDYIYICNVGYNWDGHEYTLCIDLATSENPEY